MLVRLIYASRADDSIDPNTVNDILEKSVENNQTINVSGVLLFSSRYFLQLLEGEREPVNRTYHRILNDPRHSDPLILDYEEVDARLFPHWSMGYMGEGLLNREVIFKYSGEGTLNPYTMSGGSALGMLIEMNDKALKMKGK